MADVELGKRRNGGMPDDIENNLLLKVRTKEGSELDLVLRRGGIVDDLKQEIIRRLELVDKNVRLIFSGKLLDPPTAPLNSFKLDNGSFVHAVITNKVPALSRSESPEVSPVRVTVDLRNLRGLDVLLIPGPQRNALSVDEVASLRLYFNEDIEDYAEEHMQRGAHESEEDFMFRAETEWAASQGPSSEFRFNVFGLAMQSALGNASHSSSGASAHASRHAHESDSHITSDQDNGTLREFMFGFFLGLMLGFMMIFCVWDRNVSKKQKVGILLGVIVQSLFTAMQQEQTAPKNNSGELHQSIENTNLGATIPGGSAAGPVTVIDESNS